MVRTLLVQQMILRRTAKFLLVQDERWRNGGAGFDNLVVVVGDGDIVARDETEQGDAQRGEQLQGAVVTPAVGLDAEGERIDVAGISRGLGFQGVVKRWDFAGGPKSHGSHFHRRPGSVGMCVKPGRVLKGKKLPGHMGARRVTVKGLEVLRVDPERNLLVLKGSTPGARGTILELGKRHG